MGENVADMNDIILKRRASQMARDRTTTNFISCHLQTLKNQPVLSVKCSFVST